MKNKFKKLDRYTKLAILVIIIGIIIRFSLASIYHVSGDACWHLSEARYMADNLKMPLYEPLGRDQPFWSPPVFHIISAAFYTIFGIFLGTNAAAFGIKLVSPAFGSLSLVMSYLILKKLFGGKIALYGLLFVTFLPMSIDYGVFSYADSALTFFVIASLYLALTNRIILSALALSLAILTKYTGLLAIPAIIYIIFIKNKKAYLKKHIVVLGLAAIISLPWYLRNWIYLDNPFYPILNSLFGGVEAGATYSGFNFSNLLSINSIIIPFLEFFGVPDGNPSNIFFFEIGYLPILLAIWLAAIAVFFFPLTVGLGLKKEVRNIALLLLVPFLLAAMLHILNVGWSVGRRLLPIVIILAFFWANGINLIERKMNGKAKKVMWAVFAVIMLGFVFTSFAKISLARGQWSLYQDDFNWVRQNTEKGSVFMAGGQCLSYNLYRFAYQPSLTNMDRVDYVWVNQNFRLDPSSILNTEEIIKLKSAEKDLVYENAGTGTRIYRTKRQQ